MTAKGEFSKEKEIARLLTHEEEMLQQRIPVKAIFLEPHYFESLLGTIMHGLLVNKFSFLVNSIQLQLMRLMLSINGLLHIQITLGIGDSVPVNERLGSLLFLHD